METLTDGAFLWGPWGFVDWGHWATRGLAWGVAIAIGYVVSFALVLWVICRLPEDYLLDRPASPPGHLRSPAVRLSGVIFKNLAGLLLVIAGLVMLVTPGQGVLTLLIGLILLDFPGKKPLERKLLGRPLVSRAVNAIRRRWGRIPLRIPASSTQASSTQANSTPNERAEDDPK